MDRRIDTDGLGRANSREPDLVVDGLRVFVVWRDQRDGSFGVHFNRSLDGGDTWLAHDVRIDGGEAGVMTAGAPRIARVGDRLHVVWTDDRLGGADVHLATSGDAGETWQAPVRISRPASGAALAAAPQVVAEGDDVLVVYADRRAGEADVFAHASPDGGVTWADTDVRVNRGPSGSSAAEAPHVQLIGGIAHLVWEDGRADSDDIRYARSADAGRTWPAEDVRLDLALDRTAFAIRPRVAARGLDVAVCWLDAREGVLDVLLRRSADGGHSWETSERRLDEDPSGLGESLDARLALTAGGLVAVWSDTRSGEGDILAHHARDDDSPSR